MPGGSGSSSVEMRLHTITAASAAARAAKRAHLAASLAVQAAQPPRPRSQYFSRARNSSRPTLPRSAGRGTLRDDKIDEEKEEEEEDVGKEDGRGLGAHAAGARQGAGAGAASPAVQNGATGGAGRLRHRLSSRTSEDSASSVSRSVTSSVMDSDYTTGDDSTEDEDDEEEEEEEGRDKGQHSCAAKAAMAPLVSERPAAPARVAVVAAAMEAVAAARSRLWNPQAAAPGGLHAWNGGSGSVSSPSPSGPGLGAGAVAAAAAAAAAPAVSAATEPHTETPRLPPVAQRTRGGEAPVTFPGSGPAVAHALAAAHVAAAVAEARRSDAGPGGLSSVRASPLLLGQPSRRAALLAGGLTGTAPGGGSAAVGASVSGVGGGGSGGSIGVGSISGCEKAESMAEWVAQRFRTASRVALAADALARSAPGASVAGGGDGGGAHATGLRGLLMARSDGASSWYARPTRWYDPLSPVSGKNLPVSELRP